MKSIFFFLSFLFSVSAVFGDHLIMNSNCRQAYFYILDMKIDSANHYISLEKSTDKDNAMPYFLESQRDFLIAFVSGKKGKEKNFFDSFSRRKSIIENADDSPYKKFALGEMLFHRAMVNFSKEEPLKAVLDLNRSYKLLVSNAEDYPDFLPHKKLIAWFHTFAGLIPPGLSWAGKLASIEGNVESGIYELSSILTQIPANNEYEFLIPETVYSLVMFKAGLEEDKKKLKKLERIFYNRALSPRWMKTPLVYMAQVQLKMELGQNDRALSTLRKVPRGKDRIYFSTLDYTEGVLRLRKIDPSAHIPFHRYLNHSDQSTGVYQMLSWHYIIHNDSVKARYFFNRYLLKKRKDAVTDTPFDKPVSLIKARLLFEGGYYDRALLELKKVENSQKKLKARVRVEFTYRMGRTLEEMGKNELALKYFDQTIKLSYQKEWYYGANAAYHSGLIHEKSGQASKAATFYNKVLEMEFEEYRHSIRQKAKFALKRVQ